MIRGSGNYKSCPPKLIQKRMMDEPARQRPPLTCMLEPFPGLSKTVSLSLESKRFAYFVSALALFNLDHVSDAESRALEAKRLDVDHQLPLLHLLLAQIDELKGDLRAAETELRDCLKYAKDSLTGDLAKQEFARLDSAPN